MALAAHLTSSLQKSTAPPSASSQLSLWRFAAASLIAFSATPEMSYGANTGMRFHPLACVILWMSACRCSAVVLRAAEGQAMAHKMREAGLDRGLRESGFEAIHCPTVVCLRSMKGDIGKKPKLGASLTGRTFAKCPRGTLLAIHRPKASRLPSNVTLLGHIYSIVLDLTALSITDFDPKRVEENDRIHRLQCTVLPVRDLHQ